MRDNGYIRKIDELGRIVIPKELRQRLKIYEGENLVINTCDNNINISKYSYIENNTKFIKLVADRLSFYTNYYVLISDLENIIYCNQECHQASLPESLREYINRLEPVELSSLHLFDVNLVGQICIVPVIVNSSCLGLVILASEKKDNYLSKTCKLLADIISIHLDMS